MRFCALVVAAMVVAPGIAFAQHPDSTALPLSTAYRWSSGTLDSLPVDTLRTALGFLPGVLPGSSGALYVRGGSPEGLVTYLDGVPVQPGVRGGGIGTSVGPLTPWATGVQSATLTTGPYGSAYGNGISGLLDLGTRRGGDRWAGNVRYSTDELSGKAASFGVNRIEGMVGGPLGRHVTLFAGAFVHGQQSATSGVDGAAAPLFTPYGTDTTLAVPSAYGSPTADTTYVAVANWAVYRGDCSAFSGSADPGIARNYGATCQGDRIPLSASTSERYQFRLDAAPDDRSALWFSALGGRDQARRFDYYLVQDAQALTGEVNDSRVWTLGARRQLSPVVTAEATISLQHDQSQAGPLDPANEIATRDPFGGFLIAPLQLRWNLSNFPVDDQLVLNYRDNIAGSRRSPYDLSNTAQYGIIDRWRNDAYGLLGYAEGGGPTGRLSLYDETRVVGRGAVEWRSPSAGTFTFGVEGTHYDIASYSHILVSQFMSDVWREKPVTTALYFQDHATLGDVSVDVGLRYQTFRTGAERPWLLDTVSTDPGFNTYSPFPRTSTYGLSCSGNTCTPTTFGGKPLLQYRADASHTAVSPSLSLGARLDERTTLHAGVARQVEVPDFAIAFSSINTDLQLTNTLQPFGSDLGFEDGTLFEAGMSRALAAGLTASATGFHRRVVAVPGAELTSEFDPATKTSQNILVANNVDGGTIDGVEVLLSGRVGLLSGSISYAYEHASRTTLGFVFQPPEGDRPHSLSAVATLSLPAAWRNGTLVGRAFARTAATAMIRYASGARDYGCPTPAVTSSVGNCPILDPYAFIGAEPARLPSIKIVDLRVSRAVEIGGRTLSAFVDAHNLFNFRNYNSALGPSAATSSATDEAQSWSADSAGYASEAQRNGVFNNATGAINLSFGGTPDPRTGCGTWMSAAGNPASPNCVALIRAEQRYGNGDGIFSVAEQQNASRAQYLVTRGLAAFTDPPRRIRVGIEVTL